ncbi:phage terminase large subunit family protein [Burkholderia sp. Nafp2/4-1b]|uniref:phage terminase large subunit family protein n=1 Tax=Burkholderia sp. Nafp2/4-1b TaxID=2116686 RepID=UPI001F0959F6|nr:phage terminase large subunit family protein [Burkholderia sp. Nafp2/4-1b]
MSAKASASPGRYNPNITPWVVGMHAALDDPRVQKVVCMKFAQVTWTDGVLLNYIGRRIDVDPCRMIVMFAKEKSAKKFNLEKFEPMIQVTPRLAAKVPVHAGRDKRNLWDHKTFQRGFLKFITSNAPDDVKSTPAPLVAVEEPDDANTNVRDQGDSITLLEERNKSYSDSRRKVIFGGTPTVDEFSRIQQAFQASDQRIYLVPCPDCGEEHERITNARAARMPDPAQPARDTLIACCEAAFQGGMGYTQTAAWASTFVRSASRDLLEAEIADALLYIKALGRKALRWQCCRAGRR